MEPCHPHGATRRAHARPNAHNCWPLPTPCAVRVAAKFSASPTAATNLAGPVAQTSALRSQRL
eukprot:9633681-Lingulodinium_polyedra.AAC.1